MTYFKAAKIQGNDPDDAAIDIEATAEGKLEVVGEITTPIDNLVKASGYSFNSSTKKVSILDDNVSYIYSVYNQTLNKMLYVISNESFSGVLTNGKVVTYNNTVAGVADTDVLIIFYVGSSASSIDTQNKSIILELKSISEKLDVSNKYLKKLYNPE